MHVSKFAIRVDKYVQYTFKQQHRLIHSLVVLKVCLLFITTHLTIIRAVIMTVSTPAILNTTPAQR